MRTMGRAANRQPVWKSGRYHIQSSPGGATQISPALQRWEQRDTDKVAEGRPNSRPES